MGRYKSRAEVEAENRNAAAITILIAVVLFSVFFLSPGMMITTFSIRPYTTGLDRAQMWIFSVVASAASYAGLRVALRDKGAANRWYLGLCVASLGAFAVAKFGFHAVWADRMFDFFARGRS